MLTKTDLFVCVCERLEWVGADTSRLAATYGYKRKWRVMDKTVSGSQLHNNNDEHECTAAREGR